MKIDRPKKAAEEADTDAPEYPTLLRNDEASSWNESRASIQFMSSI